MIDYKIGDVLYGKDGYNCTNVYFYKVIDRTAKTLTIQPIESKVVDGDPMRTYYVVADESKVREVEHYSHTEKGVFGVCRRYVTDSNPFKVRLDKNGTAVVRGDTQFDTQWLDIWDGKPKWANTGFNG